VTGWTPIRQQCNGTKRNVIRLFKLTSNLLLPYMCSILMSLINRWHSILFEGWGEDRGSLGLKFQPVCRQKRLIILVVFLSPSREMPGWCFSWATINPIESSFPGMHKSQGPDRSGDWNFDGGSSYFGALRM